MSVEWLNINQSPEELTAIYQDHYYDYLESKEFQEAFHAHLRTLLYRCPSVLDVGCGTGILSEYVNPSTFYFGVDGSVTAIREAQNRRSAKTLAHGFAVQRLEQPMDRGVFHTLVFGGILSVLLKPEMRVPFLRHYIKLYGSSRIIIYDLQELDTTEIEKVFGHPKSIYLAEAKMPKGMDLPSVKLKRKILEYLV